jgi:integrase
VKVDVKEMFFDSAIAWPKRAHWWHYVEEDENFALWLMNTAAGSPTTAIENARVLARFLDLMGWVLDDLLSRVNEDKRGFERQLELFARNMESNGYKKGYINNYFKVIRSWLRYNDVELKRRIKLNRTESKRVKVPNPDEVDLIIQGATARQAVCVSCVAYGGLRTEVLGQPQVYDGLKLEAIRDLDIESLEFLNVPAVVFVERSLSKIGLPYRTFLPEPATRAIIRYLTIRRDKVGEELSGDSPLVAIEEGWVDKGFRKGMGNRHVRSKTISQDIRKAIGGIGEWRPYDLRHYFLTWMKLAVARRACSEGYRIYWAGQRAKTADVYDLYKEEIPSAIVDDMREQYAEAQEYLLPKKAKSDEERLRMQSLLDFARVQGWPEEKLRRFSEVMNRSLSFEEGLKMFRKMEENLERPR